jgi:hypothetical protein
MSKTIDTILHKNVKERHFQRGTYFHVRFSSTLRTGKFVSQKYFFFNDAQSKNEARVLANKKAAYLEKRHIQLRQAYKNTKSLVDMFFKKGEPIGISVTKRLRDGYEYLMVNARITVDGLQQKKAFTLARQDPELLVFDRAFNHAFLYMMSGQGKLFSAHNLMQIKTLVRSCLVDKYQRI